MRPPAGLIGAAEGTLLQSFEPLFVFLLLLSLPQEGPVEPKLAFLLSAAFLGSLSATAPLSPKLAYDGPLELSREVEECPPWAERE